MNYRETKQSEFIDNDHSCKYCNNPTVCKCKECNVYYCNDSSDGISHIIYHMVKSKHIELIINDRLIYCEYCKQTNLFKMGYTIENESLSSDLIEHLKGLSIDDIKSNKSYLTNLKFFCKFCGDYKPIIKNKVLDFLESFISDVDIKSFEKNSLPIVRVNFTPFSYVETFKTLIKAESLKEKDIKESMKQENVKLRLEENYVYFCYRRTNELKINISDEIRFSRKNVSFIGVVCRDQFTDELKVEINESDIDKVLANNIFNVEFIWKSVCYDRMKNALNKLYKDRNKNLIFKLILSNQWLNENTGESKLFKENLNGEIKNILVPNNFPTLNDSQAVAVKASLNKTLTLIQGPPGTGKTFVSAVIVYNFVKLFKKKVLIVAPSNTAVDQLAIKINSTGIKVLRVMSRRKESEKTEIDFLSLHTLVKSFKVDVKDEGIIKDELIKAAEVVCCTCVTAGMKLFKKFSFPVVLIDEAVQCTEPLSLIPCVYNPSQLILVGDHKQLGPTVLNKDVIKCGFKQSLFERLLKLDYIPYLLTVQYRMIIPLCEFPSEYFYSGLLKTSTKPFLRNLFMPSNFFYCCDGKEEVSQSGTSYVNKKEAVLVKNVTRHLFKNGILESQIGIITPYEGQRSHILDNLQEAGNLEISNVDGFQGREKDFIIVSLVRSNNYQGIGFVADRRRMNVTLTRAKYGLVIIGDPFTLNKCSMWADLLAFYDNKGRILKGSLSNLKNVDLKTLIN
ncbi:RENT1 [Hepatospora eriocheir]|uniref:RENT1 n=1 Tax=Hepatospora eriocheir TaxID=1081669 RepID=A0A1X0QIV3_9MICR|nr:RENT1 [Hepatospora eriocheir]